MAYGYSIIIPHKNIPRLLERCLASIPIRDDVQVIVVDDDSDPEIVDFGRFPGSDRPDTRIIFTKGENGRRGAGYARNAGMEAATGRWLVFADADDLFLPQLGEMMDMYGDSSGDIVFFGHTYADSDTLRPSDKKIIRDKTLDEYRRTGDEGLLRYRMWAPWGKFIKRELVEKHGIRFSEVLYSNDMLFSIMAGHYAAEIILDDTPVYCYTYRDQSLTGTDNLNWDSLAVRFEEDVKAAEFLNSIGKGEYLEGAVSWRWKNLMRIDRQRARPLLPIVRKVSAPKYVRGVLFKINAVDPVAMPFRKAIRKIKRGRR